MFRKMSEIMDAQVDYISALDLKKYICIYIYIWATLFDSTMSARRTNFYEYVPCRVLHQYQQVPGTAEQRMGRKSVEFNGTVYKNKIVTN